VSTPARRSGNTPICCTKLRISTTRPGSSTGGDTSGIYQAIAQFERDIDPGSGDHPASPVDS
jgi:hypothetical protein